MRSAMTQALLGLVVGAPVAMLCVRYMKAQLYEVASVDLASWHSGCRSGRRRLHCGDDPARRAASINPVQALRVE